jgi:hypothetical protein
VKTVLDGISDWVKSFALEPRDLQLFKGLYSLHRVSPLKGSTPHYVAILSYVEQPDIVGNAQTRKTALWPCFANPSRTRRFAS